MTTHGFNISMGDAAGNPRKSDGFTLLELIIVVAIVGIIAAIAYPAYVDNVREARRATAQAELLELAQWMERQYSTDFSYLEAGATPTLPFTTSPRNGGSTTFYTFSFSAATATTFTIQAAPAAGTDQANDSCGTMTIDETGQRTAGGTNCW